MIRVLPIIFFLIACNSNSSKFKNLSDELKVVSSKFNQLDGKWIGTFQKLNPIYDTIYYEDLKEKLEYKLSGAISDSSLVKSIIIKDTFELLPITLHFFNIDSTTFKGIVKISGQDIERETPITIDISRNMKKLNLIRLGEIQSPASTHDSLVTSINLYRHESLQQALNSDSFELELRKQSHDSLIFGLQEGYGLIKLGKVK